MALWVGTARLKLKKGKMPAENMKRLKEAGINLLAGTFSKQPWEEIFYDLKKFIQKNETWPDYTSKQRQEKKLYGWLQNQRANYRKGKLTEDRIRQLKGINFVLK